MIKTINGREIVISDEERTPCEVWSRVCGYYRPTSFFNVGRLQEHKDRVFYVERDVLQAIEESEAVKEAV